MKTIKLDMIQYDCPYIRTSREHEVAFQTKHWEFDRENRTLETRMIAAGENREELSDGLEMLDECQKFRGYELLMRKGNIAVVRSEIEETSAMNAILRNDGYITGPFVIRQGSEIWNVGFDRAHDADDALSELDRDNEYKVEQEENVNLEDFFDVLGNVDSLQSLLGTLDDLTETEQETLEAAVNGGYFNSPRGTTLEELSTEFDISKMGASKNLRRGQRKVLEEVVDLMDDLDESDTQTRTADDEEEEGQPLYGYN
jgi:predicted DNA binding protein